MPITLVTGPANAGKAQVVLDAVRRHVARGEEPLLILPTRADAEHYLRELAGERTAMGVTVGRFDGLIDAAVRRAGIGEGAIGGTARERLLTAIAERELAAQAGPGFVRALASMLSELEVRRVSPARLREALGQWSAADGAGATGAALARLFDVYRSTLGEIGQLDEDQRAMRALDALRRRPALWGGQPVLLYGFDDLTRLQLDAIETLGTVVGASVTVSLAYEPGRGAFAGRAASFHALAPLAAEHRALPARAEYYAPASRGALSHLERSLFEPDATRVEAGQAIRLLEGGGERAELELVAREIHRLLDDGMAPEEIAVAIRGGAAGADLLEEVFSDARIPYAMQRKRRFADAAIGRALVGLLRCSATAGRDGDASDLLAWLRAPGLLERPELADRLELRLRRAGAGSAAEARRLWEERHWPLETIDQLREAADRRGPAGLIERTARELQRLFCAPRRGAASVLGAADADEGRALSAGRRALAELRELARLAPALAPADPGELARALEHVEVHSGRGPAPGAVAVLDPLALRARRVRALFVCGLQEGVSPAPARPQPFLAEEERRRLAETSGLRLASPEDALAAERYLLYAAVSRPEELLYLSWHLADDDGEPTARSLFVEDVCDLFDESLLERRLRRALGAVDAAPASVTTRTEGLAPLREETLLAELGQRPWSASSLETWISCPARWFVERMLRPGDFDPEAEPLARGGLAHAVLKETLAGLAEETGSGRLTPATLPRARELLHQALAENEPERPLSAAPERLPAARRRLRADLERYLAHAAALESPLEPRFLEQGFGFTAEEEETPGGELPALDLGAGVTVRGRIDRIDVDQTGATVVYDYKNSRAPAAGKWLAEGTLQVALYMRVAEELLGLNVVGGFYQPLSGGDLRARGLLDADSGLDIETVGEDSREHGDARALLEATLARAREAAEQAVQGRFEARPETCGWNGSGCRYPTICRCER